MDDFFTRSTRIFCIFFFYIYSIMPLIYFFLNEIQFRSLAHLFLSLCLSFSVAIKEICRIFFFIIVWFFRFWFDIFSKNEKSTFVSYLVLHWGFNKSNPQRSETKRMRDRMNKRTKGIQAFSHLFMNTTTTTTSSPSSSSIYVCFWIGYCLRLPVWND